MLSFPGISNEKKIFKDIEKFIMKKKIFKDIENFIIKKKNFFFC